MQMDKKKQYKNKQVKYLVCLSKLSLIITPSQKFFQSILR